MTDTQKELLKNMNSILIEIGDSMNKLMLLVMDYADNNEPLDLYELDGGETERKLDRLGFTNGWVVDRLMHRTMKSKGSICRKIRKAQGYNC